MKIMNGLETLTTLAKMLYHRCSTAFYAFDWEGAINMGCRWTAYAWNLQLQPGT